MLIQRQKEFGIFMGLNSFKRTVANKKYSRTKLRANQIKLMFVVILHYIVKYISKVVKVTESN